MDCYRPVQCPACNGTCIVWEGGNWGTFQVLFTHDSNTPSGAVPVKVKNVP